MPYVMGSQGRAPQSRQQTKVPLQAYTEGNEECILLERLNNMLIEMTDIGPQSALLVIWIEILLLCFLDVLEPTHVR